MQKYPIGGLLVLSPADDPSQCEIQVKESCPKIYYTGLASPFYVKGAAEPSLSCSNHS